jgi:RimJ/RimL family protein N-acetyltransferase
MQKAGMRREGTLRGHDKKWGEHLDCELYGILDSDWR